MAKQAIEKYTKIDQKMIMEIPDSVIDLNGFKKYCKDKKYLKDKIKDSKVWDIIYSFVKLQVDVHKAVKDHNDNFLDNEAINEALPQEVSRLIN
jgi:hypothetical protein